jgi:hypothetical protein
MKKPQKTRDNAAYRSSLWAALSRILYGRDYSGIN